ncbi:MAG: IS66 family insertion sequence element accessory protein TnpB [Patescibacteria group bacterium]|nr:IS66 family insertion sequence element accessory protein TnpB [Patescibacteria group bacterium]
MMLIDPNSLSVMVYTQPIDMRKAIDGLSVMVSNHLKESPTSGALYVFYNRGHDKLKILYWDRNGFCLFYKRLEKNRFKIPYPDSHKMVISMQHLRWLLEGLDITKTKGYESLNYQVFS